MWAQEGHEVHGLDINAPLVELAAKRAAAHGLTVAQDLQAEMLESYGELSLRGATIGVSLSLRGSRLSNPFGRRALNAPQLTVERTLYLTAAGLASLIER